MTSHNTTSYSWDSSPGVLKANASPMSYIVTSNGTLVTATETTTRFIQQDGTVTTMSTPNGIDWNEGEGK